eukprot:g42674.t1
MTYRVHLGDTVLNKHVDHLNAITLQTGQEQNLPGPTEQPEGPAEPIGSPPLSSVEETSESKMDVALMLLPLEEEEEILLRPSRCRRWAMVWCMPPVSEPSWRSWSCDRDSFGIRGLAGAEFVRCIQGGFMKQYVDSPTREGATLDL